MVAVYIAEQSGTFSSPVIEGNKLTTGESNNLVSYMNKTKITDTLNSDAKIYVYERYFYADQTLATIDPAYLHLIQKTFSTAITQICNDWRSK